MKTRTHPSTPKIITIRKVRSFAFIPLLFDKNISEVSLMVETENLTILSDQQNNDLKL